MRTRSLSRLCFLSVCLWFATACPSLKGMDHITMQRDGQTLYVDGRTVLDARDGGILFLARDGQLWRILPTELVKRTKDDAPFRAFPPTQMSASVMADLPKGFEVYQTMHYMIVYDTSRAYAQWCGALFERLYMAFRNAWSRQGFELAEPEFRLVAIIFSDKAAYVKYSEKDFGDDASSTYGYYNMESNRMVMYDLVGVAVNRPGRSMGISQINQFLANPNAPGRGFHDRPRGDAPDCLQLRAASALERLPQVVQRRDRHVLRNARPGTGQRLGRTGRGQSRALAHFMEYLPQRPANSLITLIGEDKRFVDPKQAIEAYAEAWALTYYLIHKHPKQYIAYLKILSRKQPLVYDAKAKRLAEFEKQFGPPDRLDADFVSFTRALVR